MDLPEDQLQLVLAELRAGRKIQAIKIYRAQTETSLADAKAAVERLADEHQILFPKSGCGTAAIFVVAVPILLYFCLR